MSEVTVQIPGALLAKYADGVIVGWTFLAAGGDAGYFGPSAIVFDEVDDDTADALELEDTSGPFWTAVQGSIASDGSSSVVWEG